MPHAFGQDLFVGPMVDFLRQHPRVTVEWLLRDEVHDFVASGIDCAVQVGEPNDLSAVAVRVAEVPRIAVAAPSLLAGGPPPEDPQGLSALPWLALRTYYQDELQLTHARSGEARTLRLRPRLSTDSLYALRSAALRGLGVAVGSAWLLADDLAAGRLLHLAPHWQAAPLPVYLVYPQARHRPSRLTRLLAALREAVPALLGASAVATAAAVPARPGLTSPPSSIDQPPPAAPDCRPC